MGKVFRFLGGATIGAAIGVGAAILFAPQSGKELQSRLSARREEAMAAAKAESAARERELRAEYESRLEAKGIKRQALKG